MKNLSFKRFNRITLVSIATAFLFMSVPQSVYAEEPPVKSTTTITTTGEGEDEQKTVSTTTTYEDKITDADRSWADEVLLNKVNSLKVQYALENAKVLDEIFNSAVYYIAYTDMTKTALESYVTSVQSTMTAEAEKIAHSATTQYLQVADNWTTPSVVYGQSVNIVLPIINLGTEELRDITITPAVSNDVTKWPFEPDMTGYTQTEPFIPAYVNDEQAYNNRREFTYTFTGRSDVMTGFYPLTFNVSFTRAGVRTAEDTQLTVYVQTTGKPESGVIGGNGHEDKKPKSRIIVTGYETNVERINSGDNFELCVHVQNTSSETAVSNILINFSSQWQDSASATSSGSTTMIDPFMPTSGSNSIYIESISPKETKDINISMSSRPGMAQMSYPLYLDMTYDSGTQFDLTDKTSISIPIYQEAKFDTSNTEVTPSNINVGSQSNVMFSIYNTGKTTLYNTQVMFEGDSIENNMAFVGNLASGATGNVDIMLTGVAQTMDDGTINMIISYEDDAGNVTKVEKTCTLFVNEAMESFNPGMREPMVEEEPENSGVITRVIIIAVVVLVIALVVWFIVKRRKKKKEAALLEKDLMDIEE